MTCQERQLLSQKTNYFLRVILTLTHYSDILPGCTYGIWHVYIYLTCFLAYTLTFYLTFFLTFFLTFYLASILTYFLAYLYIYTYIFWLSFWHSIWYIFGDSLWLKSGGEHSELAVKLRQGPLWSGACSWGPAGTTAIKSLQLRGPLQSRACSWGCSWGPAEEVEQKAGGGRRAGQLTENLTTLTWQVGKNT